ncbi:hypothetical protein FD754_012515, partial [Muntiacus muntjak]
LDTLSILQLLGLPPWSCHGQVTPCCPSQSNGNPLLYSCLENATDRGACTIIHEQINYSLSRCHHHNTSNFARGSLSALGSEKVELKNKRAAANQAFPSKVPFKLQARTLEWVAIPFSRGSSDSGSKPRSPALWADSFPLSHQGIFPIKPRTAARQASRSFTVSWSLLKLMSIKSVTPSIHLILCHPLLLLPSICPSIRVFSNESALRIRWLKCWRGHSLFACIGAQDPYCGWDVVMKKCTTLEESLSMTQWEQSIASCPTRNLTVDGHFGAWSPWTPCTHTDGSAVGSCLCRTRSCDSPAPQCGGWQCQGPRMEIVNCSRNGGWTPWTSWSPCSTTCGIGFQVRQRSCSNPTPRHGGRVCVGQNREERYCNEHLLCPPHVFWTGWGPWERCTAQCGGGIQARRRTCENGPDCAGCNVSWSEWSDWSECDVTGVQVRVRQCVLLFPVGSQCSGNTTESRPCVFDSNFIPEVSVARSSSIEEKRCGEFNLFHMIAVGLSSSILGCLLTLLVYTYCQRYQQQSHDATVIHPVAPAPLNTSITNHINKLDKYDSVEAIKAFNKNNLILEERNKYFNPHLTGKTYSNAYFTDLNNYDEPVPHDCPCLQAFRDGVWIHLKCISSH